MAKFFGAWKAVRPYLGDYVWKGLFLGALFILAPFWVFAVGALFLYFVPFFHPWPLFFHFLATLFIAGRWSARLANGVLLETTPGFGLFLEIGAGILVAILFAILLGIKDLAIVRRANMLRGIILSLAFFLAFETFLAVPSWQSPIRLLLPALLGIFVAILSTPWFEEAEPFEGRRATLALLAAEASMVLTILPLAAAHKAAVFLLLSVVLLETGNASESEKGLESALALFALLFFLSAALFTVARWGI